MAGVVGRPVFAYVRTAPPRLNVVVEAAGNVGSVDRCKVNPVKGGVATCVQFTVAVQVWFRVEPTATALLVVTAGGFGETAMIMARIMSFSS